MKRTGQMLPISRRLTADNLLEKCTGQAYCTAKFGGNASKVICFPLVYKTGVVIAMADFNA
jgi:hypothetical protein